MKRNFPNLPWMALAGIALCLGIASPRLQAADTHNVFGQTTGSEAAMMGILYDFKQTQDHQPTGVDAQSYWHVVDEFLSKGWDESVLNHYYRVSQPIFTTQIFVPSINADTAPKAFGAEKTVKPSRWIIHYKVQVSPPEPGTYRFAGSSDDLIAVAVNGKTEMVAPLHSNPLKVLPLTNWSSSSPPGIQAVAGRLCYGDWVEIKAGEIIDLDVIIGERPGGWFNAFLMVEKQGATYDQDPKGNLILPIFQLTAYDTPSIGQQPHFAKNSPPWKSYQ